MANHEQPKMPALKSSFLERSNDLGGYCFRPAKRTFFPQGGARSEQTGSNEPQRLSARSRNKLFGGYTSHDFVTARARCAITTALQPSTSINRGLIAVPKVE